MCPVLTKNLPLWSRGAKLASHSLGLSAGKQRRAMVGGTKSGARCPNSKSQLCHLLAVLPWVSCCVSLGLSLASEAGEVIIAPALETCEDQAS